MSGAYYNENDAYCCNWLSNLMDAGLITPGKIDDRSIHDVSPDDVRGYRRVHFFAGLGGWDRALNLAGWGERECWTGSCPCQPFSAAGKRKGEADERHLWPEFRRLIAECRPSVIFGEQVASRDAIGRERTRSAVSAALSQEEPRPRLDATRAHAGAQKRIGLRSGTASSGAAGSYQQRLVRDFWPAVQPRWWEDLGQSLVRQDRSGGRLSVQQHSGCSPCSERRDGGLGRSEDVGDRASDHGATRGSIERSFGTARAELDEANGGSWLAGVRADLEAVGYRVGACDLPAAGVGAPHIRQRLWWVADADGQRSAGIDPLLRPDASGRNAASLPETARSGATDRRMADSDIGAGGQGRSLGSGRDQGSDADEWRGPGCGGVAGGLGDTNEPRLERRGGGFDQHPDQRTAWSSGVFIPCADGKARRVEPGIFPLVDGLPLALDGLGPVSRVGALRGAGNAIVPQVAAEFIAAFMECAP